MASQVFSGTGNFSYTNNTGQNVRVIVNYCSNQQGGSLASILMNWASVSITIGAFAFGRNLAFTSTSSSNGYVANNMLSNGGTSAPTEIMLSNGQSFSLSSTSSTWPNEAYNIVVIPEAG